VRNVYFDFTPSHLITGFITEEGVIENKPEFSGRIAEEIRRIEKIFAERYQRVR
jgi:methylthioribose-1-phosphate isomerase